MTTLNNPRGTFATEEMVRMLTEHMGRASIDTNRIQAPVPMDAIQQKILLKRCVGEDFLEENLIYEPTDITVLPSSSDISDKDLMTTEVLAAGENIASFREADTERMEKSMAKTKKGIPGEMSVPIGETEAWAKHAHTMKANQVSAHSMPLAEACSYAGIPLIDGTPTLKPADDDFNTTTSLQPWQPSAIAWSMRQLDSPLHGGILSDACGLGKTLTSLSLVYYATRRMIERNTQRQEKGEEPMSYRASLVIVPARVLLQWVGQIDQFFGNQFRVIIFWGDPDHIGDAEWKNGPLVHLTTCRTNCMTSNQMIQSPHTPERDVGRDGERDVEGAPSSVSAWRCPPRRLR